MKRREHWQAAGMQRMSCNPLYTGIRVHQDLCIERPRDYDRNLFMHIAHEQARKLGSEQCIRNFLKALKQPDEWSILIPVHPCFAYDRQALMSEADFIKAGVEHIFRIGVDTYFGNVLENLSQGSLAYGPGAA